MWGINFEKGTGNDFICAMGLFSIIENDGKRHYYKIAMHPDRGTVLYSKERRSDEYVEVAGGRNDEARNYLTPHFPTTAGFPWTWQSFLVALTFYGEGSFEGYQEGFREGEAQGIHYEKNRNRNP